MGVIIALHGFLGLPTDWNFLGDGVRAVDLFREPIPPEGDVLLGYSMGGRLALHALLGGARYRRAVIVSAAISPAEAGRRERDEAWAKRFEGEPWRDLMRAWNAQPLFGGHEVERREEDFDRAALARALRDWSPAALPPLAPRLHEIAIPILWIAGQRDAKYVAEGERAVGLLPAAELWVCPEAGHRVPWERREAFVDRVRRFAVYDPSIP